VVELAGFEPAAFPLRKMQSNTSDQGIRDPFMVLWRVGGTSDVRQRETRQRYRPSNKHPSEWPSRRLSESSVPRRAARLLALSSRPSAQRRRFDADAPIRTPAQPGSASVQDVVGGHGDAVLAPDALAESSRRLRDRLVVHGTVDGGREALR
jgi:hypothetical protein